MNQHPKSERGNRFLTFSNLIYHATHLLNSWRLYYERLVHL